MSPLDWSIIGVYLAGLLAMSVYLGRGQETGADYYVGGRTLPWWAVGISTMATQTSVNSFISVPAFVALRDGGGMGFVNYELALPLAMIFVMALLLPTFRKLQLISVYEYLETRFNVGVRCLVSGIFLLSRALATGVTVYATALVLQVCVGDIGVNVSQGTALVVIILFVGAFTILYDCLGGMKAVVWSDVIQMAVLLVGLVFCIAYAVDAAGGLGRAFEAMPTERWRALHLKMGTAGDGKTPFWAFLVGGFFLYASYYGTDQTQVQRQMSAATDDGARRSLLLNGLARFPLVALYMFLGFALFGALAKTPALAAALAREGAQVDELVPQFVLLVLPKGIRALLIAALLAAAMSSLDSTLNALSASTMQDFVGRFRTVNEESFLAASRATTVVWGVLITGFAILVAQRPGTKAIVELINQIGSAFYGPVLAAFFMGIFSRVSGAAMLLGVLGGVACNIYLWLLQPEVHFIWWNFTGFVGACAVATFAARARGAKRPRVSRPSVVWSRAYTLLLVYFISIVAIAWAMTTLGTQK